MPGRDQNLTLFVSDFGNGSGISFQSRLVQRLPI